MFLYYRVYAPRLAELGCRFIALPMDNKGTHPWRDLLLFFRFLNFFRRERPDVYLGWRLSFNHENSDIYAGFSYAIFQ